eukprot:scaffold253967_cov22-Tisochrysis_lutea.AAC.1
MSGRAQMNRRERLKTISPTVSTPKQSTRSSVRGREVTARRSTSAQSVSLPGSPGADPPLRASRRRISAIRTAGAAAASQSAPSKTLPVVLAAGSMHATGRTPRPNGAHSLPPEKAAAAAAVASSPCTCIADHRPAGGGGVQFLRIITTP